MHRVMISGIGVAIPEARISNDDLVASFNTHVERQNEARAARGEPLLSQSSAAFISHASGVESRHVHTLDGILDPERMAPHIPPRADDELSVMAEFGAASARRALDDAGLTGADIDLVICAASHHQRPYPAIGIEIQNAIGAPGAAFDMGLGCSSAAAGLHVASNLVRAGAQHRVMVVTPEIITAHLDFRDRQTHFIFGDASTAVILERAEEERPGRFEVIDTRGWTHFSNNIRSNFGFMLRSGLEDPSSIPAEGNLIKQVGNKVFKDVTIAGHQFIVDFLAGHELTPHDIRRFWLHQANARMNAMILKLAFGEDVGRDRAPLVLDRLGNTAAAGAVIALAEHHKDMQPGDWGLLCAFGAGYSIAGALLRMM